MEILESSTKTEEEKAVEDLSSSIIQKMKSGQDKFAIIESIMEMGVNEKEAKILVEAIEEQVVAVVEEEQITAGSSLTAFVWEEL